MFLKGLPCLLFVFLLSASEYIFEREIKSILDDVLMLDLNFWGLQEVFALSFPARTAHITHILIDILKGKEIDPGKLFLLNTVYTPDMKVREESETT